MPPENNDNIYDAITQIDFNSLISAPLTACVDAQAQAATATANYIERTGFQYNPSQGNYTTRTLSFVYYAEDGWRTIHVPLISVVPVPFLQIHNVDLNFTADVSVTKTLEGKWLLKGRVADSNKEKIETEGSVDSSYESDFKVKINIKASTADMPMGVSALLQVMQDSIQEKEI